MVSIAEHQRPVCEALAGAGVTDYLGHKDAMTLHRLRSAMLTRLNAPELRRLALASATLVDGQGAQRVIEAMHTADTMRISE